jgi:PKHD-type hydroxylase
VSQAQPKVRKSHVTWISDSESNHWIYERILNGFKEANDALFDFEFTNLQEIQYIKYNPFHYFRSHFDCSTEVTSKRKLGISIQLSESSDYLGGAMTVEAAEGTITLPRKAGTALIFPPYLKHQAKTVYFGSRHCLVTWVESERSFR